MPSEVFGFALTRIDPAGYSVPPPYEDDAQRGHETTASYRPAGTFGTRRLTCSADAADDGERAVAGGHVGRPPPTAG